MRDIPFQRYAGRVFAHGVYGLPSLGAYRVPRGVALVLGTLAVLVLLRALGFVDDDGLFLAAGPVGLLQTLQAEKNELEREQDSIHAAAEKSGWSDDLRERDDVIAARIETLNADIRRTERHREAEGLEEAVLKGIAEEVISERDLVAKLPTPFSSSNTPLGEQLLAVARSTGAGKPVDARLTQINAAAAGLNERVDSEGGFLVQHDTSDELLQEAYETGVMVRRTRQRPVTGTGLKIRAVDETSRATGSRKGGIQVYWSGEADEVTATKPKFRVIDLDLDRVMGVYYATDELLQDATALQADVSGWFREEFGFAFDDAVIRGNGVGQPLGVLNSPALVSVAKEAGQAADTLVAANFHKMFARMPARSLRNATWFNNQDTWPQIFALEDTAGHRIYLPGGRIDDAPFGLIHGRPIEPIEQASTIGDQGDVLFLDLNQYLWISKGGIEAATSIHVEFLSGQTAFRFRVRVNGAPIPASAVAPYKGSATLSPFVTLDARA